MDTPGSPVEDMDLVERIAGDERITLAVIATGLPTAAVSPPGQVVWLLMLLLGVVVVVTGRGDDNTNGGHGGGNGGGGGGLGRPIGPLPTTPAATRS